MGLLDRLMGTPSEEPWRPPLTGACACADHRADLAGVVIDASPPIAVKDLPADAVTVVASPDRYVYDQTNWRRGPYQWRLAYRAPLTTAYDADAPAAIDDMLFAQSGIENLLRLDETTLAIGAAEMCADGIAAAFLSALSNPRVRRAP